jgi:prepilin-type N-terminal cleavage/methylation domain-containing protein
MLNRFQKKPRAKFDSLRGQQVEPNIACRQRAFTLIELLVTMSVISILASLLLPALSRAKESGRRAVCINNLRQIGLGLSLYVGDYTAYPYFQKIPRPARDTGTIDVGLQPYTRNFWTNALWKCPSFKGVTRCLGQADPHIIFFPTDGWSGSYAYNPYGTSLDNPLGLGGILITGQEVPGRRESEVRAPSQMIAFGDSQWSSPSFTANPPTALTQVGTGIVTPIEIKSSHGNRFEILFCDAHIGFLDRKELFGANQLFRRQWNYDFQPH